MPTQQLITTTQLTTPTQLITPTQFTIPTVDEILELMLHEVFLRFASRDADVAHEHRVDVAHATERGAVTAVAAHDIATPPTVMLQTHIHICNVQTPLMSCVANIGVVRLYRATIFHKCSFNFSHHFFGN